MSREEYLERMEKASIVNTLDNLMTFPRLRKLIERGAVTLHGAYFGVATGELSVLDQATGEFRPVAQMITAKPKYPIPASPAHARARPAR